LLIQRDGPSREASLMAAPETKNRRLISEVAFISLPGGAGWLGFRRAVNLNGKDLPDAGPPLGVLLTDDDKDGPSSSCIRAIAAASRTASTARRKFAASTRRGWCWTRLRRRR